MAFETLCMGCMSNRDKEEFCPKCGYDEKAPRGAIVLPHRIILNNQYLVGRVLGKPGGFGIAYLGWDTKLLIKVAIKEYIPLDLAGRDADKATIIPHSKEDGELFRFGLEQFLREARTLAQIDHANVVRVRSFFEENGTAYLVMDYYNGVTLEDYITHNGKLPVKFAIDIMMPILDGLREVHAKGFLHRDVKPQNIYITKEGRPILLDFGAARMAMGERSQSMTVVLTPGFAPIEQYHRRGRQGPWTDIYACAATIYYMTTGQKPPEAIERIDEENLISPDRIVPSVSSRISKVLLHALSIEPNNRPQSVKQFQAMLLGSDNKEIRPGVGRTEPNRDSIEKKVNKNVMHCTHCGAKNLVPGNKSLEDAKCERCHKPLLTEPAKKPKPFAAWMAGIAVIAAIAISFAVFYKPAVTTGRISEPPVIKTDTYQTAEAKKKDVSNLIDKWVSTVNNRDLSGHVSCYADNVERYFESENTTKTFVSNNKGEMFAIYSKITMNVDQIQTEVLVDGTAVTTFKKSWNASGKETFSGEETQRLKLRKYNGAWKIYSEEELEIYWVIKNGKRIM